MQADYQLCLPRLLTHEGGYTNDPRDPGGPTNYGITIYDGRKYWKAGATAEDMRTMPLSVAQAIYDSKYWHAMWCDRLPPGVDDVVFDYGVNSGNSRAVKVLQRTLHWNTADGMMSAGLLQAALASDPNVLIDGICDERMRFLRSLSTFDHFGPGWTRRVTEVRAFAHQLAHGATPAIPAPAPIPTSGKGQVTPPGGKRSGSAGTVVVAGASSAAQAGTAREAIAIIIGTVVVVGVGWAAWELYHRHRQDAPA